MAEDKNKVEEAIEEAKAAAAEQELEQEEVEAVEGAVEDSQVTSEDEATDVDETETDEVEAEETEEDSEEATEDVAGETKKKKNIFGKEKKAKVDPKDEKIAELTDRVTRQMAEFDNFRKRTDREKSERYEIGAKDVVEKILPIVDNFERGFQGVTEEQMADPFVDGMDKVYKQLLTVLEGLDVKAIPAVGEEFNPDLHNAVMHIEDEELGENVVAEEFQKGYTYRSHVVRHSMVKVAN
ncbi:MAG: nucleotide exchange factor GrpE [Eubacteriales bacterium]